MVFPHNDNVVYNKFQVLFHFQGNSVDPQDVMSFEISSESKAAMVFLHNYNVVYNKCQVLLRSWRITWERPRWLGDVYAVPTPPQKRAASYAEPRNGSQSPGHAWGAIRWGTWWRPDGAAWGLPGWCQGLEGWPAGSGIDRRLGTRLAMDWTDLNEKKYEFLLTPYQCACKQSNMHM